MNNSAWPESFGFSVGGGRPVVILCVDEDGSARGAGLQVGDQIMELNGRNVQQSTVDEVKDLARQSDRVPPVLSVISRVRTIEIRRGSSGGFGFTLRGNGPIFVRSVDVDSPGRAAGLRSGDMILQVGGNASFSSSNFVARDSRLSFSFLPSVVGERRGRSICDETAGGEVDSRSRRHRASRRHSQRDRVARYDVARQRRRLAQLAVEPLSQGQIVFSKSRPKILDPSGRLFSRYLFSLSDELLFVRKRREEDADNARFEGLRKRSICRSSVAGVYIHFDHTC